MMRLPGGPAVAEITFEPGVIGRAGLVARLLRSVDVMEAGWQFCDRGDACRTWGAAALAHWTGGDCKGFVAVSAVKGTKNFLENF